MQQGSWIDGRWICEGPSRLEVISPNDDQVVFSTPIRVEHAELAIEAARRAAPAWAALSQNQRAQALKRIETELAARQEIIAEAICREVGKPLWEARGEAKGLAARVGLTCGPIAADVADWQLPNGAGGGHYLPLGVVAVLGPFNFPAHLANGQILPALLLGNTVILKPSEKAAGVAALYAEALAAANLPAGVFNMVQGDHRAGQILSEDPRVDGVLFTGSTRVGKMILAANHQQAHKMVSLEMGGKNASLVCQDADLNNAAAEILNASMMTCGQRCTATSQVYVHQSRIDELAALLRKAVPKLPVGDPFSDKTFMGPIIDQSAKSRLLGLQDLAQDAGVETLCASRSIDGQGAYLTPALRLGSWRDHAYFKNEHFGPDLVLIPVSNDDEGMRHINDLEYGLASSVFCAEQSLFNDLAARLRCGLVNWNRGTAGATGMLPFGGWRNSGNHRPGALFAGRLVSAVQARLHGGGSVSAFVEEALRP
jgi:succinylglutamic semialdehyde dehydrogenase